MDLQLLITLISWKCFPFFSLVCNALNHLKKSVIIRKSRKSKLKRVDKLYLRKNFIIRK